MLSYPKDVVVDFMPTSALTMSRQRDRNKEVRVPPAEKKVKENWGFGRDHRLWRSLQACPMNTPAGSMNRSFGSSIVGRSECRSSTPPGSTALPRSPVTKLSVILTNYNNDRFLRAAIDSALVVRWPDKQVIVIDDGSTDDSLDIMASYGDRILADHKPNGGQSSAANLGYLQATGDVVIFLDSDDVLMPDVMECVSQVWTPTTVLVRYPMELMDDAGKPTGSVYPNYHEGYTPELVRSRARRGMPFLTSPMSGNAFSKNFLDKCFPIPKELPCPDGYLTSIAGSLGDVATIARPLVRYRLHGNSAWTKHPFAPSRVAIRDWEDIVRTRLVNEAIERNGRVGAYDRDKDYTHLMKRVVHRRWLWSDYPYKDERAFQLLLTSYRAVLSDEDIGAKTKLMLLVWFTGVATAPSPIALYLAKLRFVAVARPKFVAALLRFVGWWRKS
jgi:glycosyltransferase involved in cell wall biosynthesis